jgi:ABC-type transport system involved in multi-copper enzyme maturation permease subunit
VNGAGFGVLVHAEWTKFRTVRGWVIGMVVAAIVTVLFGVFLGGSANIACGSADGAQRTGRACEPRIPVGPGGQAVSDTFYFVHRSLSGNGTITVEVTSLTGKHATGNGPAAGPAGPAGAQPGANFVAGLVPWAKAGIIIKNGTRQGSAYAAMMVTGAHGVRMQYNYTGDVAGLPGLASASAPRWLRLVRSGDTITGYDSADGRRWTKVGSVTLGGLPGRVQLGLFSAAPGYVKLSPFFGGASIQGGPSLATATFDQVKLTGTVAGGPWSGDYLGGHGPLGTPGLGHYRLAAGRFTVTGSGDIAPVVPGAGNGYPTSTLEQSLVGTFAGLIAIGVVGAMFFTSEYRRGLLRLTLAASPRRGQLLAAKAAVVGLAAFVVGLVAAIVSVALGVPRQRAQGLYVLPVPALTEVRVIVGTALMVALVAVLATALGAVLRRSAAAITGVVVAIVLPFLLAVAGVFPAGVCDWLLRLTPAAGFAVEQSIPSYFQVSHVYQPAGGFYPLPPLAGFGVLCAWTAGALALALVLLSRRDA